jgi:hypothetical protein
VDLCQLVVSVGTDLMNQIYSTMLDLVYSCYFTIMFNVAIWSPISSIFYVIKCLRPAPSFV